MKLNNTFTAAGRSPVPTLSDADKDEPADVVLRAVVPWEILPVTANPHRCTPLWYARLRDHGLLHILPEDLRDYPAALRAAGTERNPKIRTRLVQFVAWFKEANILGLLLRGGAGFADELDDGPMDLFSAEGAERSAEYRVLSAECEGPRAQSEVLSAEF